MKKIILTAFLLTGFLSHSQSLLPEMIVQRQVDAYNNRDVEAFLSYYSEDAKIYYFPNVLNINGKDAMRRSYETYFKNAKTLTCRINKRIVRGNTIIDEEFVNYNGSESSGVAIYEILNDKIIKVTFID